jgi:hypothetical protein
MDNSPKKPNPKNRVISKLISLRDQFKETEPVMSSYVNDIIGTVVRELENHQHEMDSGEHIHS